MRRQSEVDEMFNKPVFDTAKQLAPTLRYEPPVFKPGESTVQSLEKTQILIGIDVTSNVGEPATIAGTMWEFSRNMVITFSVPERIPDLRVDAHTLVRNSVEDLAHHYRVEFCNDKEQVYIETVQWDKTVDASNRTDYVIRINYRFYDYNI